MQVRLGDGQRLLIGIIFSVALSLIGMTSSPAQAYGQSTEERFQDLFVTAGYCTAFGAAIGAAFLSFTNYPTQNLEYVAVGASLGFLGGSALGSYVIFSPMVVDNKTTSPTGTLASDAPLPRSGIVLRPTWNREQNRVASIEGGMTLLNF